MDLHAEFAIRSKQPGDTQEYRVLAAGPGALGASGFEAVFRHLSVGSAPAGGRPGAEDEPAVTCGAYLQPGGEAYVAVIRQERTELKDGWGRTVSAYSCACVPYSRLASSPASYLDIYSSIPTHEELRAGSFPAHVQVEPLLGGSRLRQYARIVDDAGYEFCAALAAWVLHGGVALMRGLDLGQRARLEYLDAIACLLPYGSRAALSVSTWMQSASRHSIRLGFSDQARRQETRVVWGGPTPTELEPGAPSEQYHRLLLDLRQIDEGGRPYTTLDVLTHLAERREPLSFESPEPFVRVLYELNQPYLVWRGVREGRGDVQQVRELFRTGNAGALPERRRQDLLRFLLSRPRLTSEDVEIVSGHWHEDLRPALLDSARARLEEPGGEAALEELGELAWERGGLPEFLHAILEAADSEPSSPDRRRVAARLLLRWWLSLAVDRQGARLQPVRESLGRHRSLLSAFALEAARELSTSELEATFAGLERGSPAISAELRVFRIAAGLLREDADGESIRRLASSGPDYVPALVDLALGRGGTTSEAVERVLAGVLAAWPPSPQAEESREWRQLLPRLADARRASPRLKAQVDLCSLLLARGSPPPFLAVEQSAPPGRFGPYAEALLGGVGRPGGDLGLCVLDAVLESPCASSTCARNTLYILGRLLEEDADAGAQDRACLRVLSLLDTHPELLGDAGFTAGWEARLASAGFALQVAERRLREALDATTPEAEVAERCAGLLAEYGPDAELAIIRVLNEKRYLHSLGRFDRLRERLRLDLGKRLSPREVGQIDARLELAVLDATLAPNLSGAYRRVVIKEVLADLEQDVEALTRVAKYLREEDSAALARMLKELQALAPHRGLGGLLRKAR
jgi:hypothetical protein